MSISVIELYDIKYWKGGFYNLWVIVIFICKEASGSYHWLLCVSKLFDYGGLYLTLQAHALLTFFKSLFTSICNLLFDEVVLKVHTPSAMFQMMMHSLVGTPSPCRKDAGTSAITGFCEQSESANSKMEFWIFVTMPYSITSTLSSAIHRVPLSGLR